MDKESITPERSDLFHPRVLYWIASYPKSGNTWLRFVIDAYMCQRPLDINNKRQRYVEGDANPKYYQALIPVPLNQIPRYFQVHLRSAALLHQTLIAPGCRLCLKTHQNNCRIDGVPVIPPKLTEGAIYIVRDPRDIVLSWADHAGVPIERAINTITNPEGCIQAEDNGMVQVLNTWANHVLSWQTADFDVTVVRYEDLLEHQGDAFRAVLREMGLYRDTDECEEKLQFALSQTTFDALRAKEDRDGFYERGHGEKFFRVGKSGQWKDVLRPGQVEKIERECGKAMKALGYELTTETTGERRANEQ